MPGSLQAQQKSGVRGKILADDGSPLSYATIFVKQLGSGTTANIDGIFEILLESGRYDLVFQHLGRKTEVRVVTVGEGFTELNITLSPEDIVLQSVTVNADDEDPAYSIMRKAIAMSNYHRNLLDSYSARVYIKGAGKLKDHPWLAKKALEKEGIEKGRVYISESVSEIKFTRPNKFEEKVISIHSDGKDNNTSPNAYIFGSFYQSEVDGTISPLSPKAFSYYRFEYLGTFKDRDYEISRIKVIPRSRGDNVVEGTLNIVENTWSIHSLDLHLTRLGMGISMKAVCAPIEDKAWLPVSHQFTIDGKFFGFEFEYHYLTALSDYKITLNPKVYVEKVEVIDEKKDKERAKEIRKTQKTNLAQKESDTTLSTLQKRLASGEEITRKELKTLIKEYEKEERRRLKEPEVVSDVVFKIDSGAYKKDSAYWALIRPVPLTKEEIKGYEKTDSLASLQRAREAGDTLKSSKHKGFQPWDLIIGDNYRIAPHTNFRIYTPLTGFNTVEGFNLIYKLALGTVVQDTHKTRIILTPAVRYAFSREKFSGYGNLTIRNRKFQFEAEGGRYIRQFNGDEPILPVVNTFTTLFLEKNLMKLYEHDFIDLRLSKRLNPFVTVNTTWSWAQRSELTNHSNYKLINHKNIEGYTPNKPVNTELTDTGFPQHTAFVGLVGITAQPWLKYRMRNGRKYAIESSSPVIQVSYRKGFPDLAGSDVDFNHVEAGVKHRFRAGGRGYVIAALQAGMFFDNDRMYFMDFKHFPGNRTPFVTGDPVGSFRLLDYYQYSTSDRYLMVNVHYQFRKFLVTTIPYVRLAGIRENVFINHLSTPATRGFTEVGYSIDGILRIFRLEGALAFSGRDLTDQGFRIGISTSLAANFSD